MPDNNLISTINEVVNSFATANSNGSENIASVLPDTTMEAITKSAISQTVLLNMAIKFVTGTNPLELLLDALTLGYGIGTAVERKNASLAKVGVA